MTSTAADPAPVIALNFIQDAATPRDQCLQRLGPPTRETTGSTGGQVLMYRFGRDTSGLHTGWSTETESHYSLVLSFDDKRMLTRQALVKVGGR